MDTCVQCRGCETACPSAVPFGRLMEATRETIAREVPAYQPWWRRLGYRLLANHRLLLLGSTLLACAQRVRLVPSARLGLPAKLPLRRRKLRASGHVHDTGCVILFTGCVMDAWQRDVHAAAQRVIEATGTRVAFPAAGGGCCGALATHAGLVAQTRRFAAGVMASMPGQALILVDSAGCGAQLKDYGHLLQTTQAVAFSARVRDIHEWLAEHVAELPAPTATAVRRTVAVQDPCHLRHVQRTHLAVRIALGPFVNLVELDDEGLCCGAGGAYSVLHPDLAGDIRTRKLASVARSGAPMVASANPGCSMHLAAAGLDVRHPVELIAEAIA